MNNSDRTKLIDQGVGQPKTLTLNLALPIIDQESNISGTVFGCWDSPNATDMIYIRFNDRSASQIPFKRGKVLRVLFSKIYITVPAGLAGNMEFIYGSGPLELFDVSPNITEAAEVLEGILRELQGDIAAGAFSTAAVGLAAVAVIGAGPTRIGGVIQASLGNNAASIISLGFTNAVTAALRFAELAPGMSWNVGDYRGPVWAICNMAAQSVNFGVW